MDRIKRIEAPGRCPTPLPPCRPAAPRLTRLAFGLLLGIGLASHGREARADKEVVHRLLHNQEFKVRLQAAIYLAKLQDPSSFPALVRCLEKDDHYLVRAFCASGLGRMGKPAALPALKNALRDPHDFVRKRVQSAIDAIEAQTGTGAGSSYEVKHNPNAKLFVILDTGGGSDRRIPSRVREFTERSMRLHLHQDPGLEVARSGVAVPDPWLLKRRLPAVKVDVRVEQVRRKREKSRVVVETKLKVIVTRHPARAVVVITMTEAQSSQEVRSRLAPRDLEQLFQLLERQSVEGAVERVIQRIRQVKLG